MPGDKILSITIERVIKMGIMIIQIPSCDKFIITMTVNIFGKDASCMMYMFDFTCSLVMRSKNDTIFIILMRANFKN